MPLVVVSQPPPPSQSRENPHQGATTNTPLRPALSTIGPSSISRRPVLADTTHTVSPAMKSNTEGVQEHKARFPTATINVGSISDVMAARLVTCLLGHVLFLKSQVPFPVAQLIKMSSSKKPEQRSNKKQEALLASFDLLSSHLGSTFTALAAAPALSSKSEDLSNTSDLAKTHLAIVLGPTATNANAARARVVLELDGFRVASSSSAKISQTGSFMVMNEHLKENIGVARFESPGAVRERPKGLRNIPLAEHSDESSDDELNEGIDEQPPESDFESVSTDDDSDSSSDIESTGEADESSFAHEESEADLSAAERLLSRALAIANADPEQGMAVDIRATQTHILLRAPRRFDHPAWVPRQNLSRDMDPVLREFDDESESMSTLTSNSTRQRQDTLNDITNSGTKRVGNDSGKSNLKATKTEVNGKRRGPGGIKTDYVRVRSQGAIEQSVGADEGKETLDEHVHCDDADADENEDMDDEMIWWSWDGKLEGFADL